MVNEPKAAIESICKINIVPIEQSPQDIWRRLFILMGAAVLLWLFFFWIAAPSERFNALLVPLWILNFVLARRRLNKFAAVGGVGAVVGVLGFYILGSIQASHLGAHVTWWEPLQKLYFTVGLFVLCNALCAVIGAPITLIPGGRELMTAPRGWWLRLLCIGVTLILFTPYIYVSFNTHRFKYVSSGNPQTSCGLPFQMVDFSARDGAQLKGWFIPSAGSQRTIVIVHGIGSNRGDMLSVVPFLHRAGFNLFLFDLRGHGESSGHTTTFGVNEARDVEAAAQWISRQPGGKSIGMLAYSMGGSSVLHAVGENGLPEVRSIVLDSTFAEFAPLAREQLTFLPEKVVVPVMGLLSFYTRLEIGVGLDDIAPRRYIGRISPRPLLLIHGTGDSLIPSSQARLNYASAKQPKALYWIDGAEHCAGHRVAGEEYEKRVISFFDKSLR
ncbi:hypothetical protein IAD21_03540 [Abditibacteriota bacterium]|nr:hypothetical protein IAD21_03540 [Abditibacteriota bacterium]